MDRLAAENLKMARKASDHRHECTSSNEPDQAGSIYGRFETEAQQCV